MGCPGAERGSHPCVSPPDSAACEGRSLLRAFVTAAVQRWGASGGRGGLREGGDGVLTPTPPPPPPRPPPRAERVLVLLFDVPRERFEVGLSPTVRQR